MRDAGYDDEPLTDVADFMVDGFMNFVTHFSPEFQATEMQVYSQPLGIAGTLDMIIVLTGYAISYGTGPSGEDEIVAAPGQVLVDLRRHQDRPQPRGHVEGAARRVPADAASACCRSATCTRCRARTAARCCTCGPSTRTATC